MQTGSPRCYPNVSFLNIYSIQCIFLTQFQWDLRLCPCFNLIIVRLTFGICIPVSVVAVTWIHVSAHLCPPQEAWHLSTTALDSLDHCTQQENPCWDRFWLERKITSKTLALMIVCVHVCVWCVCVFTCFVSKTQGLSNYVLPLCALNCHLSAARNVVLSPLQWLHLNLLLF